MRVLMVCGSNHQTGQSRTHLLLRTVQDHLQQRRHTTRLWSLRDQPLPIAEAEYYEVTPHPIPIVNEFREAVAAADAIILGSPNYHGSYSGAMKNALEHLSYGAFGHRPVGLISHGSGMRGANAPCEQLRIVVKAIHGYALCTQVASGEGDYAVENGVLRLTNAALHKQCGALIDEMERLVPVLLQLKETEKNV